MIYNYSFSLVSVNVRVNQQHSGFETPVATVGMVWESEADTWISHVFIATAVSGVIEHMLLDKSLQVVDKAGVGEVRNDLVINKRIY